MKMSTATDENYCHECVNSEVNRNDSSTMINDKDIPNTAANNDTLISFGDYINKALPLHLQKLLQEHYENFDPAPHFLSESSKDDIENHSSFILNDIPMLQTTLVQYLQRQQDQGIAASISNSQSFSSWSFAQGLIVGQISVVVALVFFIKFFIFGDSFKQNNPKNPSTSTSSSRQFISSQFFSSIMKRGGKDQLDLADDIEGERSRQIDTILEKTYYNVDTHPSESLDWFNVLIAQTIQQFREEAWQKDNIMHSLNSFIERKAPELPSYLDDIKITELDIGDDFPIFSNCRIQYTPNSNKKKLEAKIDIDLNDRLAVGVETKLLLNYPKPSIASLPINLTVAIIRFQACLTVSLTKAEEFVSIASSDDDSDTGYFLIFSFAPEYRMEFETDSLIGARSKLENIPKIGRVIEYQIKKWFVERCVEPRFQFVKLPSMWPRSRNTRKAEFDDTESPKDN
ncbi:hypothetical protein HG535_0A05330 [Zygotorulaspora mrakii]|uniref:Maintenance of mitochondrial morphology protein 1 n=1 Tax=Zygotorulaspora mrakii TaxID=42260 RepID=A0A7H9AYE2_ZYGMR|nr:uncharacterized protein HG535_0A05330 [Zygotorulaspora mrakii]QLG70592.1 hypothetical protein HG535_0A05330 [Zygotorulaspora mrakii]